MSRVVKKVKDMGFKKGGKKQPEPLMLKRKKKPVISDGKDLIGSIELE